MSQIDPAKERQRLAALYGGMEDLELEEIAKEPESLTDVAKQALRSELSRRGIEFSHETTGPATKDATRKELPRPVIVRRYRDLLEASIAKSILDSAGIESILVDDNIVRIDWFYSNLVGGIKILVREEDAETAVKLLEQVVPEKFEVDGVGEYEQPQCPNCKSMQVSFNGLDKRMTYTGLAVGLPIPITNKDWKCDACGNEWEDDADTQSSVPGPSERH
jgi:hypothetical protein